MSLECVTKIDVEKWSRFVDSHPCGSIFQTPDMYSVFENTKKYDPFAFAVIDEGGDIQALLVASLIREFNGVLGGMSSRSVIQSGPLFIDSDVGRKALKLLIQEYDEVMGKKALYGQIRNNCDSTSEKAIYLDCGYEFEEHLNFLIDLKKDEGTLFNTLDKKRRYGVRKCAKHQTIIREINDRTGILESYDLLKQTYENVKLPLADVSLFLSAQKILGPKKMFKVFMAESKGVPIATILLLLYRGQIYDWYAGASGDYLHLCPNDFIIWHTLKFGIESHFSIFDFGGAGKPDEPYGVREFKKQFGGRMVNYGRYQKMYHPVKLKIAETGFNVIRKLR